MSSSTPVPSTGFDAKRCCSCETERPASDFTAAEYGKQSGRCRDCVRAKNRASYLANKEKRNAKSRDYYEANRERLRDQNRQRQIANRDQYRAKALEANRRWREEHRDEVRTREAYRAWVTRLKKHGLTPDDYDRILAEQGGVCALCGTDDPGRAGGSDCRTFAMDHCHTTGAFRALLCHHCNKGLGYFRDHPEVLVKAAKYVQKCCPPELP